MGVGHLSPTGTQSRFQEILEYKGNHTDTGELGRWEHEHKEETLKQHFINEYGFEEPYGDGRIRNRGFTEKVLAETRHGVELRTIYHPSGHTQYFYLVVVTDKEEPYLTKENLALQHLQTYYNDLQRQMQKIYGVVKRKTTAWTSETVEVEV